MMTVWLTPAERVEVASIVEARQAAIIFVEDEIADGADPTLRVHEFRVYDGRRVVGIVSAGQFYPAH